MAARRKKKTRAVARTQSALALPKEMEDEFTEYVNRDKASTVAAGWPFLSTQGSTPVMTLAGVPVGCDRGDMIEAVILSGARVNNYYGPDDFVPGKTAPPVCYAIADPAWKAGEIENKLAPPADLKTKCSDSCAECRFNAFGSGRGNAKACKNTVRLAMFHAGESDFSKADGLMLSVPPTAMRSWAAYVAPLAAIKRPVFSVVTEIEKIPNTKGAGFSLALTMLSPIQDKTTLRALAARLKGDGGAALVQPPPAVGDSSGTAKPQRRRKVKKKARRKKK